MGNGLLNSRGVEGTAEVRSARRPAARTAKKDPTGIRWTLPTIGTVLMHVCMYLAGIDGRKGT